MPRRSGFESGRKMMTSSMRFRNSGRRKFLQLLAEHVAERVAPLLGLEELRVRLEDALRADVARHDDDGVREVGGATAAVGEAAVVEHLEEQVEDVGVRLLDLVEEEHAVGPAPHRLGEEAALLAVDVARRRADEALRHVLLHELAHVDAGHRLLVVEEELGERLGELRLADAGRAEEEEAADRLARIAQARRARGAPPSRPRARPRSGRRRARESRSSILRSFSLSASSILRHGDAGPVAEHLRDGLLA